MQEIIDQATRLGKSIADSSAAKGLRAAREAMNKEKELLQVLKDYQAQADKVETLEHENKPVEVADKHRLQELHDKLVASDVFKKYTAAQVDYIDLMRKVNEALRAQLREIE